MEIMSKIEFWLTLLCWFFGVFCNILPHLGPSEPVTSFNVEKDVLCLAPEIHKRNK